MSRLKNILELSNLEASEQASVWKAALKEAQKSDKISIPLTVIGFILTAFILLSGGNANPFTLGSIAIIAVLFFFIMKQNNANNKKTRELLRTQGYPKSNSK